MASKQEYQNIINKAEDAIQHYNKRIGGLKAAIKLGKNKDVNAQLKKDINDLKDKIKEEKDKIKEAKKHL